MLPTLWSRLQDHLLQEASLIAPSYPTITHNPTTLLYFSEQD